MRNIKNNSVRKIIIFDENYKKITVQNYRGSLFLISINRLETFINNLFFRLRINKISGVLLTGVSKFTTKNLYLINYLF